MGQALLQKTQLSEATKYLELAISKVTYFSPLLFLVFQPISPFCNLEVEWIFEFLYLSKFVSPCSADVSSWFLLLMGLCSWDPFTKHHCSFCFFRSSLMRLHLMLRMLSF